MTLHRMKELDTIMVGSSLPNNEDDDIEEGIHFNKTQKIPISLIKQQEKLPAP
jgi:hypothetical protein